MNIPEQFEQRLESEFGGRYRIRVSEARGEFHVEQRIGAGFHPGTIKIAPQSAKQYRARWDDMLRARDGYVLTFIVTPGDRTECPSCHATLHVPVKSLTHLSCPACEVRGKKTTLTAGYWPLNDDLLQHLRRIDAYTGGHERIAADIAKDTAAKSAQQARDLVRDGEAAVRERFKRMVGIPQQGYTGKESAWLDAPAPNYTKVSN